MDDEQNEHADRAPWASRVVQELKVQRMTRAELGKRLKPTVSERTIRNVLDGVVQPDPSRVEQIARVVGLEPLLLFRLLGWVNANVAHAPSTTVTAAGAVRLLHSPRAGIPRGIEVLVSRAVELAADYHFVVRTLPTPDGQAWRDYLGLAPTGSRSSAETVVGSELHLQILTDFGLEMQLAPALFEDSEFYRSLVHSSWPQARAWLWVPRLLATRDARIRLPLAGEVDAVVVVGEHGAGAEDIGARLADVAGWGYVNSSLEAQRAFIRSQEDQATHAERSFDMVQAYLQSPYGRFRVIAHGNPATSTRVIQEVHRFNLERQQLAVRDSLSGHERPGEERPRRVALVYAEANDALIEYGSRVWGTRTDPVVAGRTADYRSANRYALAGLGEALPGLDHTVPVSLDASVLTVRPHYQKEIDESRLYIGPALRVWDTLRPSWASTINPTA